MKKSFFNKSSFFVCFSFRLDGESENLNLVNDEHPGQYIHVVLLHCMIRCTLAWIAYSCLFS